MTSERERELRALCASAPVRGDVYDDTLQHRAHVFYDTARVALLEPLDALRDAKAEEAREALLAAAKCWSGPLLYLDALRDAKSEDSFSSWLRAEEFIRRTAAAVDAAKAEGAREMLAEVVTLLDETEWCPGDVSLPQRASMCAAIGRLLSGLRAAAVPEPPR